MSEQWQSCLQRRMTALYRYTRAMESGDAETVSVVLNEAEHDPVLERMILEVNEGYQIEDRTVVHADDIETVQHMLRAMTPALPVTPVEADQKQPTHPTLLPKKSSLRTQESPRHVQKHRGLSLKKLMQSRYSWLVAIAAMLLILVSLPATNVLADRFLALFRVQQFQPVSIDSQQSVQTLFTTLRDIGDLQSQRNKGNGTNQNLTQAQAEQLVGYHILLPRHLPAGAGSTQSITVAGGNQVTYIFNAAKARAYLAKNGHGSVAIPAELDGASYTITVPPDVNVSYFSCPQNREGCAQDKPFFIHEFADPAVQSHGTASITQLRDFLLSLPNLSASTRDLLKGLDEKTGTIPVPIPPQDSAEQVSIRGTTGLLLKSNTISAAIWETRGIMYVLALGTSDTTQVIDAVNSLA